MWRMMGSNLRLIAWKLIFWKFLRNPLRHGGAAGAHRMLVEVYGDNAPTNKLCREWFQSFKNGDFSVKDKPRCG